MRQGAATPTPRTGRPSTSAITARLTTRIGGATARATSRARIASGGRCGRPPQAQDRSVRLARARCAMRLREHLYVGPGKPSLVLGRRQTGTAVGGAGVKSQLDVLGVGPALHVDIECSRMHIGQRDERSRKEL